MPTIRILTAEDVREALPMDVAIEAMRRAFAELSSGSACVPPRGHMDFASHDGVALIMSASSPGTGRIGLKAITLFGGNPAQGLPRIHAVVLLLDAATGVPLALLDGASLTAIRTGAGSGVATDLLARSDAKTVAILGAGVQGRTQLEAVCAVRRIEQARVYDPASETAARFAREMTERLGVPVETAQSASQALAEADIVCAATVSETPAFADADLRPGTHVNAIGSYKPHVQEVPSATVARARVVVDHRDSALAETGDLLIPISEGLFDAARIHAEIGEIILGRAPGRGSDDEITLYKAVGVAVQDLAAASRAFDRARSLGIGTAATL